MDLLLLFCCCSQNSADYHNKVNSLNYEEWQHKKFIPNLQLNSAIVVDQAPHHKERIEGGSILDQ
jgi:hypothetical protein